MMHLSLKRRAFLAYFSSIGLGGTLLPGMLWPQAVQGAGRVTAEDIAAAEPLIGMSFTSDERELMAHGATRSVRRYERMRAVPLANDDVPAIHFDPRLPGMDFDMEQRPVRFSAAEDVERPADIDEVAFWPVTKLARLIATRQVTARELTEMYLARLKRLDPTLKCVITLTEDRAREQAQRADEDIAAGNYRGPLHGIPWGAKDLFAVKGYPTTWGATPYREQVINTDATVVQRLDAAGAVLIAKLTLGALAMGDQWFGGRTNNPWNPEEGSSGSSAGSAAATAAGCVGFAIGTETYGSILSPSARCGCTGLRPTFGRVSRHGAMALSWTMDKPGPICRTVEDCAVVFEAIYGPDGNDETVHGLPFNYDGESDLSAIRIGYMKDAFRDEDDQMEQLEILRELGAELRPIAIPDHLPVSALMLILNVEAAAAFSELTLSDGDDELVGQDPFDWPNVFRTSRLTPAVEYIQANRIRRQLMAAMAEALAEVDVYACPITNQRNAQTTNLTGHPAIVVPGPLDDGGAPTSFGFCGRLFQEGKLLRVAKAFQEATGYHKKHPQL